MLTGIATIFAFLFAGLLWYRNHAMGSHPFPGTLQGFKVLPLIGNALDFLRCMSRLHDAVFEVTAQCGYRTWAFSLPFMPTCWVVTSPENLEYVLKTKNNNFIKGRTFKSNLGPVFGGGIFAVDGQEWYWQRKLATHIFNVRSFKTYTSEVFSQKLDLLIARLAATAQDNSFIDDNTASSDKPPAPLTAAASPAAGAPLPPGVVDLHALMYRFTLDTFSCIGFGVDPGCLTTPGRIPFAQALDRAQAIANARFSLPWWPLFQLLTGDAFRLQHDVAVMRAFATDIIHQRRRVLDKQQQHEEQPQRDTQLVVDQQKHTRLAACTGAAGASHGDGDITPEKPRDLLSLFMSAVTPDGVPLTEQQLVDTVINFIVAGRDTTAQALSWTFYLLLLHPEVEVKILQEVEQLMGDGMTSGALCYDQLRQFKYTRAVFLEGLRLYPSVPADCKFAVAPDVLPDGTAIPAGGLLLYPIYTINRLPSFWGKDADAFRPERWLEMSTFPSPYSYISFNAGPRVCLGKTLAELEGVYVLVGLLQRFRFSLEAGPQQVVGYKVSTTLPMKEPGLRVRVEARE